MKILLNLFFYFPRLVTASGDVLELDSSSGDLFLSVLCGLGAVGAVTRLKIQVEELYYLREKIE